MSWPELRFPPINLYSLPRQIEHECRLSAVINAASVARQRPRFTPGPQSSQVIEKMLRGR